MTFRRHQYRTIPAPAAPVVHDGPLSIKVSSGYGRLYVGGPNYRIALSMPGATINERRQVIELSLTLESIRALKKLTGLDAQAFARFCTPDVLAYAKAAARVERDVAELHEKLSSGFRLPLPWADSKYAVGLTPIYRAPFDHQQVMATAACMIDGLAFLCEMGCVDAATEYLSPVGWRRIDEYDGGAVGQYHPETDTVEFVVPDEYVKLPCRDMIHFRSTRGVDQMLSPEHRMLLVKNGGDGERSWKVVQADQLAADIHQNRNAMRTWRLPTTFTAPDSDRHGGIPLTDDELRVQVAVMADGHFPSTTERCCVRVKRPRKIERMRLLLTSANIHFRERPAQPAGFVTFTFSAPIRTKEFDESWWSATAAQRRIIAEECVHWDGSMRKAGAHDFFSTSKASADFIQFCYTTMGWCATVHNDDRGNYVVHASPARTLKQLGNPSQNVRAVESPDGYKYCFRVPSTFLVFRRNGNVFPSGNTGKSRAGAEALAYKLSTGDIDIGIVVCPRGVIGTWKREFAQWTEGVNVIPLIDMPVKDRIAALRVASAPAHRQPNTVFVVNYDVMDSMKEAIDGLLKHGVKVGMLLDEMHRIRNPQTKTAKAILALTPYLTWRLGMTGTSVLQGAHDVWSQWYFVDLGVTFGANYVQFKREFFDDDPWTFKMMPKPGALDEIGARLRRRGIRYTKAECLDLPPKIYTTMEVEMTKDQQRAYEEMESQLVAILSGERPADWAEFNPEGTELSSAANQLAAMLRLTQVTSGFLPVDGGKGVHYFTPNPKLDALEEIVEEAIEEQQIVVWARYRADHDMITQRLARFAPKLIRGGVSQADRDDIETGFQDGRYRLIVAQPGAGGVGLNFWRGSLAIYYSQSYSLEHRMQSEDRTHRAGSEMHSKVTYIDLVAKNSVDFIVSAALRDKKDVADVVVDLKKILGVNA